MSPAIPMKYCIKGIVFVIIPVKVVPLWGADIEVILLIIPDVFHLNVSLQRTWRPPMTWTGSSQSSRFFQQGVGAASARGAHGCSPDPMPPSFFLTSILAPSAQKRYLVITSSSSSCSTSESRFCMHSHNSLLVLRSINI